MAFLPLQKRMGEADNRSSCISDFYLLRHPMGAKFRERNFEQHGTLEIIDGTYDFESKLNKMNMRSYLLWPSPAANQLLTFKGITN